MSKSTKETLKIENNIERVEKIYEAGFIPGWIGEGGLKPEPIHDYDAKKWKWRDGKKLLNESLKSVNPKIAERRNIRMANNEPKKRSTLNSIHTSYQMVAPNEFARAHRHTVNAGRFILESSGAFTTLDGKKVYMEPNDIILTPNWVWHGLGNDNNDLPASWVDFLDDPLVANLKTIFFETRDEDYDKMETDNNSVFHYTWLEMDKQLEKSNADIKKKYGKRIKLETPSIPTMDIYLERLEPSITSKVIKSTANHIFICAEGIGETKIKQNTYTWERGDVIAVPSWTEFKHNCDDQATLVEITDQPLIEMLGWYRQLD